MSMWLAMAIGRRGLARAPGGVVAALLIFGLVNGSVYAADSSQQPAGPAAVDSLGAAVNAMYNAEYDRALNIVRDWLKDHPIDIQALNYLAEAEIDQEMLRENLYNGAAFLNSGKVFKKREQPLPPGFEKAVNDALDHAQQIEEARLQRDPHDEQALYWLGVTHSTRTEFLFALERSYFSALREGRRAWEVNERLAKMDPHCADADFVIGIADYAAGIMPWYMRMVTSLAGIHGNAARGIQELKHASADGQYTRVHAKTVLIMIYERRKEYPQALALLRELGQEYPRNYLVSLETGRIQKLQGDWAAATATYDEAVRKYVRGSDHRSHTPRALILLRAGQAHEHTGDLEAALDLYHEAAEFGENSKAVYQAELAAARLDQHFKHPERARQEYRRVADSAPDPDLGDAARQALREMQ